MLPAAVGSSALCEYLCAAVGPVVSQTTALKHAAALHLRLCRKQLHLRQALPRLSPAAHVSEDHLPLSFYSGNLRPKARPERNSLATGATAPEQQPSRPCCSGRVQREAPWLPASAAGLRRCREGAPRCATLDVRELWVKRIVMPSFSLAHCGPHPADELLRQDLLQRCAAHLRPQGTVQ